MKNVGTIDRMFRVLIAEMFLLAGIFWFGGSWRILFFLVAFVMLFEAATGVCGIYGVFKFNTCENVKRRRSSSIKAFAVLVVAIGIFGAYASINATAAIFADDLIKLDESCKTVLNDTVAGNATASSIHYEALNLTCSAFRLKYIDYTPFSISSDKSFSGDLKNLSEQVSGAKASISEGDLVSAGRQIESARETIDAIASRNGINLKKSA